MPDDHGERAGFDEPGESGVPDDLDGLEDPDGPDGFDDRDGPGGAGRSFPGPGYLPGGYPGSPSGYRPGGRPSGEWLRGGRDRARRGLLLAATALVAAGAAFGLVTVALRDASASPAAAGPAPSASVPGDSGAAGGAGNGPRPSPQGGGIPSLPAGATLRLLIGGRVTAVSATSITIGGGERAVTAAVTRATTVTGKVTSIGGVKVGDLVSASVSGANGKLAVTSIQDPASLPSASGQ